MSTVVRWLIQTVILEWLWVKLRAYLDDYLAKKNVEKEREESNRKAEQKLEEAESEKEVIDAGGDLLKR